MEKIGGIAGQGEDVAPIKMEPVEVEEEVSSQVQGEKEGEGGETGLDWGHENEMEERGGGVNGDKCGCHCLEENRLLREAIKKLGRRQELIEDFVQVEFVKKFAKFQIKREHLISLGFGVSEQAEQDRGEGKRPEKNAELVELLVVIKEQSIQKEEGRDCDGDNDDDKTASKSKPAKENSCTDDATRPAVEVPPPQRYYSPMSGGGHTVNSTFAAPPVVPLQTQEPSRWQAPPLQALPQPPPFYPRPEPSPVPLPMINAEVIPPPYHQPPSGYGFPAPPQQPYPPVSFPPTPPPIIGVGQYRMGLKADTYTAPGLRKRTTSATTTLAGTFTFGLGADSYTPPPKIKKANDKLQDPKPRAVIPISPQTSIPVPPLPPPLPTVPAPGPSPKPSEPPSLRICPICQVIESRANFTEHLLTLHQQRRMNCPCPQCPEQFSIIKTLRVHLTKAHRLPHDEIRRISLTVWKPYEKAVGSWLNPLVAKSKAITKERLGDSMKGGQL